MRRFTTLLGNSQRLDGGAMFGNVPKALWSRWLAPDERNRIPLACRCLLVEELDGVRVQRRILLETGIGAFFEPKYKDRFGVVESHHVLLESLSERGLSPDDIDVIVLSHLHFDHAGGLLSAYAEGQEPRLLFDRARYVVGEAAWERALAPHARDRASFIPALQTLLQASGRLEIVRGPTSEVLGPDYRFHLSEGHTPGLLLTEIPAPQGPIVFAGDLIPGVPWIHLPITMGYDRYPERLIDEKSALLADLMERRGRLLFTHDPDTACARVGRDARGRYVAEERLGSLNQWIGA